MTSKNNLNTDPLAEDLMTPLVKAIQDEIQHKTMDAMEPYEFYVHRLHLRLLENPDAVGSRLVKGYGSLLAELTHEAEKKSDI